MVWDPYQDNLFRVLRMPASASTNELAGRAIELKNRITVGLEEGDTLVYDQARQSASDPYDRLFHEMFSYSELGETTPQLQLFLEKFGRLPLTLEAEFDWGAWLAKTDFQREFTPVPLPDIDIVLSPDTYDDLAELRPR